MREVTIMLLVTAPTGNVGNEVAKLLVERRPFPFRLAAHTPERVRKLHGDDVDIVPFDYKDRSTWGPALEGVDQVFLIFPYPQPIKVHTWMKPFVNELATRDIKHLVFVDVPGSDHVKIVPHYQVERHIEEVGIPHTFLRCTYFMQNLCRGISTHGVDIVEHQELFIPAGDGRMTIIDSRDVAEVVLKIFEDPEPHKNKGYTLSGPDNLDMHGVAEILSEALDREIRYTNPSFIKFWWRLMRRGVAMDVIAFMTIVYTLTQQG
ncbi:MAG: NmrA family NAD(P)-binding protein, partial [Anaerolineae bacterium]